MKPKILAFSGSNRAGSHNHKLVQAAANLLAQSSAEVSVIKIVDFDIPLYSPDIESAGTPDGVYKLKELAKSHNGYFISCPEYNGSITPMLKNTLDWLSRPSPDEPRGAAYKGKTGAVVAATPGNMGGIRGLPHVRQIMLGLGVTLVPKQLALGNAAKAFDDDGNLAVERSADTLRQICTDLVNLTTALMSVSP
ncbi:MAG: NADPH-dependent FMN reductase [Planctomycetota bacterium]|jgi:NAD(P)H-dependent FMN reductase